MDEKKNLTLTSVDFRLFGSATLHLSDGRDIEITAEEQVAAIEARQSLLDWLAAKLGEPVAEDPNYQVNWLDPMSAAIAAQLDAAAEEEAKDDGEQS